MPRKRFTTERITHKLWKELLNGEGEGESADGTPATGVQHGAATQFVGESPAGPGGHPDWKRRGRLRHAARGSAPPAARRET